MKTETKNSIGLALVPFGLAFVTALSGCLATNSATNTGQTTFRTPEAAVAALGEVAGSGDQKKVEEIFGADSADLLNSGDDVADHERALGIKELIHEKVAFEDLDDETKAALFGNDAWAFPIPLVKASGGWRFDTEAGREEIENRSIGLNELAVLATLHAVVDAQREYFAGRHDGRSGAYAKRVISSKGKQDGLYWPTPEGKPESPLGPFVAEASTDGYSTGGFSELTPFHGYFYRMLVAQGPNAGVVRGAMLTPRER